MTLDALLTHVKSVQRDGDGYAAICPAHDDREPSLALSAGDDGRVLMTCRAGCKTEDVLARLGLAMKDLFPSRTKTKREIVAAYEYRDADGTLRDQKIRFRPKAFGWRAADGKTWKRSDYRGLYRLPELLAADPSAPVLVVEGEKDVDRLLSLGLVATCSPDGANGTDEPSRKWLPAYTRALRGRIVRVVPDNDPPGAAFGAYVAKQLAPVAAEVKFVDLPLPGIGPKGDVSDYLDGTKTHPKLNDVDGLMRWIERHKAMAPPQPCDLPSAHAVFRKWFGDDYDLAAADAMLATIAAEQLDGDPVWTLLIAGPGGAKTETLSAASGADAIITSTIASEGALLSGSSKRERAKDATGGLLRRLGDRGVLVIKDFTSIISMNREARAAVLAAMREIYDGRWERNLGSDGGKTLTWTGRIVVLGAVTTAWDTAHSVVSAMGDRFVIIRIDSTRGRETAGTHALDNTGSEVEMRAELADVVGRVIAGANRKPEDLTRDERQRLLRAADLVTRCRTAVEFDFQGNVIDAHAPEMPTRFAKQLLQIARGARAIGVSNDESVNLAIRCARDSMPPLRLEILEAVAAQGSCGVSDVRWAIDRPWKTVQRQMEALHILRVLACEEEEPEAEGGKRKYRYALAPGIDAATIALSPDLSSYGVCGKSKEEEGLGPSAHTPTTANSGEGGQEEIPF